MRIVVCCALAFLSSTLLPAQEAPERKTMIFQPGAKEPAALPSATPEAAATDPARLIDMFFLALQADKVEPAYDAITRGTIIAERAQDIASLKARTREALDGYGPLRGYEVIDDLAVGKNLLRRTCLSLNQDLPLRWRFYFYKSGGVWRLVDLRVDDGLVELFEDAARKRP